MGCLSPERPPLPAANVEQPAPQIVAATSSETAVLPSGEPNSKRQRCDDGGAAEEIAAHPDIERNRQAIVNGSSADMSSSQNLSREEKKQKREERKRRAIIVQQLATELNAYKQGLGSGRSNQYGSDKRFFEERCPLYGDWLTLRAVKEAARRQGEKVKKAASVTPASAHAAVEEEGDVSPTELLQLAPLAASPEESSPNLGGRPKGSTNAAKADLEKRKAAATDLITQKVKEARDANASHKLPVHLYNKIHDEALEKHSLVDVEFSVFFCYGVSTDTTRQPES